MLWKGYFWVVAVIILFSAYFQLFVTQSFKPFELLNLLSDIVLVVGGYSYVFHKKLLDTKNWGYVFKGLLILLGINFIYQIWPSSYVGDFSLLNASLFTNVFVFLLVTLFLLPLYYAVYQLTLAKSSKKKK